MKLKWNNHLITNIKLMSIKLADRRGRLGCFIHTTVTDNIPSLTNEQSWAFFHEWYRSYSPLYSPYECKLLCSYFSAPFRAAWYINLPIMCMDPKNLNEKALWMQHSLIDVAETSICHWQLTYDTHFPYSKAVWGDAYIAFKAEQ